MSLWIGDSRVYKIEELTDEEVLALADKAGTFDFLNDKEEDIYTRFDGQKINVTIDMK